jgi:hypothetical protein
LRVAGLHHIGVGRTHARIRPPDPRPRPQHQNHQSHHRELLRDLILDPTCDYQPTGNPKGGFDRAAHAAATDVIAYMGVTKLV